jgi:hypothetical protein
MVEVWLADDGNWFPVGGTSKRATADKWADQHRAAGWAVRILNLGPVPASE